MEDIYKKVIELQEQGIPAALVTVIATKGSTPRGVGTKMIVLSDGSIIGTVGGSSVEAMVIEESKSCIQSGKCDKVTHNLDDAEKKDTGMICGGVMEFFVEPLVPSSHIYIFGGGHVALPLARMASQVGFTYTIIEDRAEFATRDRFPDAKELLVGKLQAVAQKIDFKATDFVAIDSESDHDASVWVKGTSSLEAYFTACQYDSGGNSTGPCMAFYLPYTSSSWTQSTDSVRIHPGTAKVILTLGLNNPGPDDTGSVWFDDVYFGLPLAPRGP